MDVKNIFNVLYDTSMFNILLVIHTLHETVTCKSIRRIHNTILEKNVLFIYPFICIATPYQILELTAQEFGYA